MIASNDTPATDKELDSFYGREPSEGEVQEVILRQKRAFDADDLATIAQECGDKLLEYFANKEANMFMFVFKQESRKLIANRASIELFGRVGVIKPEEI